MQTIISPKYMDEMEITNKFQRIKDLVDLSWSLTKNILVYIPSILGSDSQPANLPGFKTQALHNKSEQLPCQRNMAKPFS